MTRIRLAPLALAALALGTTACSKFSRTPCGKLASQICENGGTDDCTAFVDGQLVARHAPISDAHKQIACQTVLDDPPTVAALQRAFETRGAHSGGQSGSGGEAKKGSASK